MPPPATGGRYPPSVQFIRQPTLGNEACRHKLPNGREQSQGAGVCGPLIGQRTMHLAPAGRRFPALSLHWAIVAGPCRAQPGLRLCRGREGRKAALVTISPEREASASISRLVICFGSGSAASRPGARRTGPRLPGARESRPAPKPECHGHSLSTRIGGSYWLNTEYPVFAVGDDPDAPVVIGAWFAFGAVVAAGFAGTVAAAFGSAAGSGTTVAAG
jgi:hypothetical protein